MLTSCHIQNFRCLRDVKIDLAPVTAFVGPNASGKSAILAALDPQYTITPRDCWKHSSEFPPSITAEFAGRGIHRGLGEGPWPFSYRLLHLDLAQARQENVLQHEVSLRANGGNLANVLASLTRKEQDAVAKDLCALVPVLSDVGVRPTNNGRHQIVFQDRWSRSWYGPLEVSDGTILLLAFIVLQYQTEKVDVVAIEEPERGIHPYLLRNLVAMLRRLSQRNGDRSPIQFLLATHSAELLDCLEPEEVRFVTRDSATGETRVESPRSDTEEWKSVYREYQESLGGIWLSGGMGGVPG